MQVHTYEQLLELWENRQWSAHEISFEQDRRDWLAQNDATRAVHRYSLSSFLAGEHEVASSLAPIVRAVPSERQRLFLCTQIADEARHCIFFDRFHAAIDSDAADADTRLLRARASVSSAFGLLFDHLSTAVERLTHEPDDSLALVEAVTIYHFVIEGIVAVSSQQAFLEYCVATETMPGLRRGLTNVARDEHRHVAFGLRFLWEMTQVSDTHRLTISRTLEAMTPVAFAVLRPLVFDLDFDNARRVADRTMTLASKALRRRAEAIGVPANVEI